MVSADIDLLHSDTLPGNRRLGIPESRDAATSSSTSAGNNELQLKTVPQLLRDRALRCPHNVAISYPSSGTRYVDYSLQQLDVFAFRAAQYYEAALPHRKSSQYEPTVVGLLGVSDLEYAITMLALLKMGHTVLFISTRISAEAVDSLMQTTKAKALVVGEKFAPIAAAVLECRPDVVINDMAPRSVFEFEIEAYGETNLDAELDMEIETKRIAYIIHSSGSTGFPKPIYQSHATALANYAMNMDMRGFITLPLFHNHGICNFFRAIHSGKPLHLYNAQLPLSSEHLVKIMTEHRFEIFYGVPYALKLLAESSHGLDVLRSLKIVMYGGSACSDELGNLLVKNGVNLVSHYGASEVGQLMTSFRSPDDTAWNYVRETESLKRYLRWIPRGESLFECVVKDGYPAKNTSNQPDGSYQTKDLFEPHPTIAGAWKYIARLDDTLTLVTGEKFSPVSLEGTIRSSSAVSECVVFGNGRAYLGVLIVPSPATISLSTEQITDQIWKVLDDANLRSEAYARVSRGMIKILPHGTDYPRTDKGSIIRLAFYKKFEREINEVYDASEADIVASDLKLVLTPDELKQRLEQEVGKLLRKSETIGWDTDLFALGMDSLQAIQLRSTIVRNINIGTQKLGQNFAFDYPTVNQMAAHLINLREGQEANPVDIEAEMAALAQKYSIRSQEKPTFASTMVVTGVTGSLGAHVAHQLCKDPSIRRVYCLVRASSASQAGNRIKTSLLQRRVYHELDWTERNKLVALPFDQTDEFLGLSHNVYKEIARDLRGVIHCAWSVNFNLNLSSFTDCISGVQNLIGLCRAERTSMSATFSFCSSVSAVSRCEISPVPETVAHYDWAQEMGYAQSKVVAENICERAAIEAGVDTRILRIGQIVSDTKQGIWNTTEAITMMLQTAVTVGVLPRLPEQPRWLPVDTVAKAVCEITLAVRPPANRVFNIVNSRSFNWTDELLPALKCAGLSFREVEPREWIKQLKASPQDPTANPPIKLLDFFASKYDQEAIPEGKVYATDEACAISLAMQNAPVLEPALVNRFVRYLLEEGWTSRHPPNTLDPCAVVILTGPCGSATSIVGTALASRYSGAFLDGDSLHTAVCAKMRFAESLSQDERTLWATRIWKRVAEAEQLGYNTIILSCSGLQRLDRDELRRSLRCMETNRYSLKFFDLQTAPGQVCCHLSQCKLQHSESIKLRAQLEDKDVIASVETDIIPLDADGEFESVVKQAEWAVDSCIKL